MKQIKTSDNVYRGNNRRMEKTMIYNTTNYIETGTYQEGKIGYVNKFEKSVKIPFLSVLHNHLPNNKAALTDELEPNDSELAISDSVELSSAITGASEVGSSNTGDSTGNSGYGN